MRNFQLLMINSIINGMKSTIEIHRYLLYWLLGFMYIQTAVLLLFLPVESYSRYNIALGSIVLMVGFLVVLFSIQNRKELSTCNWYLISGIIDLLCGLFFICFPDKIIAPLSYLISIWILFRSYYSFRFLFYT